MIWCIWRCDSIKLGRQAGLASFPPTDKARAHRFCFYRPLELRAFDCFRVVMWSRSDEPETYSLTYLLTHRRIVGLVPMAHVSGAVTNDLAFDFARNDSDGLFSIDSATLRAVLQCAAIRQQQQQCLKKVKWNRTMGKKALLTRSRCISRAR